MHKEIVEMIEDELDLAVSKKWYIFMSDIRNKMLSCNARRKQWACQKLEEIQNTFKGSWLNEDMEAFMQDTQLQIEEIYNDYDDEIKTADDMI